MQARTPPPGVKREGRKEKMWKKVKGGGENHWGSFSSKCTFVPTIALMLGEWKEGSDVGSGVQQKVGSNRSFTRGLDIGERASKSFPEGLGRKVWPKIENTWFH